MPRRFSSAATPEMAWAPVREDDAGLDHVGQFEVEGVRPGGGTSIVVLDPAKFRCRWLVAELAEAWTRYAALGSGRLNVAKEWQLSVLGFARHVDAVCTSAHETRVATITVDLLHGYEQFLAGRYASTSDMPGKRASQLFTLLRNIEFERPGTLDQAVATRLNQPTLRPNTQRAVPLADFAERERLRLIVAARMNVIRTEQRIAQGRVLVARAEQSALSDSPPSWPTVVATAARCELTVAGLREVLPGRWMELPGDLKVLLPATSQGKPRFGELVRLAYRHVFPHHLDLMGHYVLLALDTGAPPECLKDLVESDCSFGDGVVTLRLVKHRSHRITHRTYADDTATGAAASEPGNDANQVVLAARWFRDTGSVLRSLLDVTRATREATGLTQLFVSSVVHSRWQGVRLGRAPWYRSPFKLWITQAGLDKPAARQRRVSDSGRINEVTEELPAVAGPFDMRRLRKSNRAHLAVKHPDEFHIWGDNELETFQRHYTRSATVFQVRAGQLLTSIAERLASGAHRAKVITPSAEGRLVAGDEALAQQLGIDTTSARQLACGERDVDGGIAGCTDPTNSPFLERGHLCDVATLGMCLRCPNAVITPRHADSLRRFDQDQLEHLRLTLPPNLWAERGLPTRLLLHQVLVDLGQPEAATR